MANAIQAIRGMNDLLPQQTFLWQWAEKILRHVLASYGYHEIRTPILEKTELFKRSIGEATDIIEKEMYTFLDRNQESLSLRPEGTAGCVRAGIEHGLLYNQIQRLWYLGPCFRHERPQKGRYRQFYQCGVEAFGLKGPDIDAEVIELSANLLAKLQLSPFVTLELNTLGDAHSRAVYREKLIEFFSKHLDMLDEDSKKRLHTNPLRILDSKNPALQPLLKEAPQLMDYLDETSINHFEQLQQHLTKAGISFQLNPRLVRGLDYYTKTVFEWTTQALGAQGAVCSGGRYDDLVGQLGGKPTPALGFGLGLERVILLLEQTHKPVEPALDFYLIWTDATGFECALKVARTLRDELPGISIITHCGGGQLKQQFKKADLSGARFAGILGEEEIKAGNISIKFLREDKPQITIAQTALVHFLQAE